MRSQFSVTEYSLYLFNAFFLCFFCSLRLLPRRHDSARQLIADDVDGAATKNEQWARLDWKSLYLEYSIAFEHKQVVFYTIKKPVAKSFIQMIMTKGFPLRDRINFKIRFVRHCNSSPFAVYLRAALGLCTVQIECSSMASQGREIRSSEL